MTALPRGRAQPCTLAAAYARVHCARCRAFTPHTDGLTPRGLARARTRTHTYRHVHACVCVHDPADPRANSHRSRNVCADLEFPLRGSAWDMMGALLEPGVPPRRRSPAHLALVGTPSGAGPHCCAPCACSFPVAEANRGNRGGPGPEDAGPGEGKGKSLDLWEGGGRRAPVICSQEGSACLFIFRICMCVCCFCSRAVIHFVIHLICLLGSSAVPGAMPGLEVLYGGCGMLSPGAAHKPRGAVCM